MNRQPSISPRLVYMLGTFFFAGAVPRAPGTAGTLAAALAIWLAERWSAAPWWWPLPAASAVFLAGTWLAHAASEQGHHDPGWFVLDEVVGMLLTATGLAALTGQSPELSLAAAFCWFRLFDILKPPPIRQVERTVPGGLGVMLDDVVAAAAAWPCALGTLLLLRSL